MTFGTPTGIRTPVAWLRTRYPRPLDDGGTCITKYTRLMVTWSSPPPKRRLFDPLSIVLPPTR